jgi:hypothetical protein
VVIMVNVEENGAYVCLNKLSQNNINEINFFSVWSMVVVIEELRKKI